MVLPDSQSIKRETDMSIQNTLLTTTMMDAANKWGDDASRSSRSAYALGKALHLAGFDLSTDFKAKSAKESGREDRYRAVEWIAMGKLPRSVRDLLRDAPRDAGGKRDGAFMSQKVKGARESGVAKSLTLTAWSKQVPQAISGVAGALRLYRKVEDIKIPSSNGKASEKAKTFKDMSACEAVSAKVSVSENRDADFFAVLDFFAADMAKTDASDRYAFDPVEARKSIAAMIKKLK